MTIAVNENRSSNTDVARLAECGRVDTPSPPGRNSVAVLADAVFPTIASNMTCPNAVPREPS